MLSVKLVNKDGIYNLITPYYTYIFKKDVTIIDIIPVINNIQNIELYTSKDSCKYIYSNLIKSFIIPNSIEKKIKLSFDNGMSILESSHIKYDISNYNRFLESVLSIILLNKGNDVIITCKDISINILNLISQW
ncbi:ORF MSV212 hypothetical protein [Melanoplus sanguinipes entomopoxvirus]|uniref:Uncharacterized protein n=1 Tax=Melanoplus sanguinipes entomopoxvirus TaxID=83191 RepID=Q9YVN0_MSEPV|nr:ORF MSV212 hypothetical protein [Melanoplus sanguinipes entomopoxvirus]AAC97752.1 ORF MSV212 hypothetical protein [Melanoplus sanguinipes entomopoxvirus 'O']